MDARLLDQLRHGEVQGGACFRGSQDDALSEAGWGQMLRATAQMPVWTDIVSSPARRCADFARHLAAIHEIPLRILDDFRERHFGAWEGLTAAQIPPADLARFWADPVGQTPPDAESFSDFRQRVRGVWSQMRDTDEPRTLLVTHGGVIRVLLAEVLCLQDPAALLIEVPHACLTRLRLPEPLGRPSLIAHGCRS